MRKFSLVGVGGTFDELHKGHHALLLKAFEVGDRVLIGLCSDEFVSNMNKPHVVSPYAKRLEDLKILLRENYLEERAQIIPINDPYGGTLAKDGIKTLVVSRETEKTAVEINKKRRQTKLPPLHIVVIDMVPSENHSPISTTRIRRGEMDREGHLLKRKNE